MTQMYLTWLGANSWLIEMAGQRILLDPWLVGSLVFGDQSWFFEGTHRHPPVIPEAIDLILLSQGLPDHAHAPTLQALDRQIPVVASANAAKVVQSLNYAHITILNQGESMTWADQLSIKAFPGSPIGPFLIENAYVITDLTAQTRLYYEPHGFHSPTLAAEIGTAEVVVAPVMDLILPILGPFIKGSESALDVVRQLQPQYIVPTAVGGGVDYAGVLDRILREGGSVASFRQSLADQGMTTQVPDLVPGERFHLELSASVLG